MNRRGFLKFTVAGIAAGALATIPFVKEANALWGDHTLGAAPSAFETIQKRRVSILIEKAATDVMHELMYEEFNEETQNTFLYSMKPHMDTFMYERLISDFLIVSNETNNPQLAEGNLFVVDIYYKIRNSPDFICLNLIAQKTSVSFDDITGKYS